MGKRALKVLDRNLWPGRVRTVRLCVALPNLILVGTSSTASPTWSLYGPNSMGVEAEPRSERAAGLGIGIGDCKLGGWVITNSAL